MRRLRATIMAGVLPLLVLAGCGGSTASGGTPEQHTAEQELVAIVGATEPGWQAGSPSYSACAKGSETLSEHWAVPVGGQGGVQYLNDAVNPVVDALQKHAWTVRSVDATVTTLDRGSARAAVSASGGGLDTISLSVGVQTDCGVDPFSSAGAGSST